MNSIPEADQIGELKGIKPGKKKAKAFRLSAGSYIVFCNIVAENGGTAVSHFAEGMFTTLDVRPPTLPIPTTTSNGNTGTRVPTTPEPSP